MTRHLTFLKVYIERKLPKGDRNLKVFQEKWDGEWSELGFVAFCWSFIDWCITTAVDTAPKSVPN